MNLVNPCAGKIGQCVQVIISGKKLSFKPTHLAGRCGLLLDGVTANNPAHCRNNAEPVGIVHVFVSTQAAKYRLPEKINNTVPSVCTGAVVGDDIAC